MAASISTRMRFCTAVGGSVTFSEKDTLERLIALLLLRPRISRRSDLLSLQLPDKVKLAVPGSSFASIRPVDQACLHDA